LAVATVAAVSLGACGLIEDARFALSMEGMEQVARTAKPSSQVNSTPRWVGLLGFDDVYREGDLVYFKRGDYASVDPYGYVWSPNREPVDVPDDAVAASFEHVQGPWYRWSESW
jgi:hypothetical protein